MCGPMSGFKFACPVCGQHITAEPSSSGKQLECPTCYQKIVVPQAPSSADAKFILSASQVAKSRTTRAGTEAELSPIQAPPKGTRIPVLPIAAVVALGVIGATAFLMRSRVFHLHPPPTAMKTNLPAPVFVETLPAPPVPAAAPIPTNIVWTLDLTNAVIPDQPVAGAVHGSGFACERAILTGGSLVLRQGTSGPADLAVNIQFFASQGEELSGKMIEIAANREPPIPKVALRWKSDEGKRAFSLFTNGYVLKINFGQAASRQLPGRLYLSLPDPSNSVVAGTFTAEIRAIPGFHKPGTAQPPGTPKGPKHKKKPGY